MEELRNVINVMALVGIPSLFACVVWFGKKVTQFGKRMEILMNAQQKQMRRELTMDYHKYMTAQYIDDDDLDVWEQAYQAYHALGENGIMDSRREDLIHLNSLGGKK
jgi:hypothetical protein